MFQLSETAVAADVRPGTLQQWILRGLIVGSGRDKPAAGKGRYRLFSFESVMQIAVATVMVDQGVTAARACKAAIKFSHLGDDLREPGRPFTSGYTLLICSGDSVQVLHDDGGLNATEIFALASMTTEAAIVVNINRIFDRVCGALGLHPQEVLERPGGGGGQQ